MINRSQKFIPIISNRQLGMILLKHFKSNTLIDVFVGWVRVGPVLLEEPTDVKSQVVKSTKQSLLLCITERPKGTAPP